MLLVGYERANALRKLIWVREGRHPTLRTDKNRNYNDLPLQSRGNLFGHMIPLLPARMR